MKIILFATLALLLFELSAFEKVTVVLDWTVNTNHTGLYVAQSKGWFKDENLIVTIESAPISGAAGLLTSGRADFAYSSQDEVLQARAAGVTLTAIAAIIQNNTSGFASRRRAGINRPKDFEGKRYGGWGSPLEEGILKALIKADGGNPDKVQILNLGEQDFFVATERNIDFAWVFEGWTIKEAELRGVQLDYIDLRTWDSVFNWYTPVLVANESLLKKNPTKVKAFLAALSRGYQYAITYPDEAATILLQAAKELNPALVRISQEYLAKQYQGSAARWGEFDRVRWNEFQHWMVSNKLLKRVPAQEILFTNDYLPPVVMK